MIPTPSLQHSQQEPSSTPQFRHISCAQLQLQLHHKTYKPQHFMDTHQSSTINQRPEYEAVVRVVKSWPSVNYLHHGSVSNHDILQPPATPSTHSPSTPLSIPQQLSEAASELNVDLITSTSMGPSSPTSRPSTTSHSATNPTPTQTPERPVATRRPVRAVGRSPTLTNHTHLLLNLSPNQLLLPTSSPLIRPTTRQETQLHLPPTTTAQMK